MKTSKNNPNTNTKAQPHNPNARSTSGSQPDEVDVQHVSVSFYTALGQLLQAVVNPRINACHEHRIAFRQAANLLLNPVNHAGEGVCLEVSNNSMWFLLDLNHSGEKFHLQLADNHAACGGYSFRIHEDPELSPSSAAFILFHIAAILGDPTVIQGLTINT